MAFRFEHLHLKAPDPKKTADWYVDAFDFEIVSDRTRDTGDRFIECKTTDGVIVRISGQRTGEAMGEGSADVHFGIEHFGLTVDDLDDVVKRLEGIGAKLREGPTDGSSGSRIAFIEAPDNVRIELLERE